MYQRLATLIPGIEMNPGLTVRTCNLIQEWLDAGFDAQLDILPAIDKAWVRVPGKVSSPQFFDGPVRKAHEKRTQPDIEKKEKADFRVNALRWKRDRGMFLSDRELAEIAQHDQQYQPST